MRGNKTRERVPMPLPSFLIEKVFRPRLRDPLRDPVWILPSTRYEGQAVRSVRGSLDTLSKALGITASPHQLRRLSATLCLRATGNPLMVKRLLTHNIEAATEREATSAGYPSTEYSELKGAMEAMVQYMMRLVGESYAPGEELLGADGKGAGLSPFLMPLKPEFVLTHGKAT